MLLQDGKRMCCNVRNKPSHRCSTHQTHALVEYVWEHPIFVARDPGSQTFVCKRCHVGFQQPKALQSHARRCLVVNDVPEGQTSPLDPYDPPNPPQFSQTEPLIPPLPGVEQPIDQGTSDSSGPPVFLTPDLTWIRDIDGSTAGDNAPQDPPPVILRPGPEMVVTHAEIPLQKLGLVVNKHWKIVICLTCGQRVRLKTLFQHLHRHFGNEIPIPPDIDQLIANHFKIDIETEIGRWRPKGTDAIAPIFGLKIHPDIHFCGPCGDGYADPQFAKHHTTRSKSCWPPDGTPPELLKGYAQTLVNGPCRSFFRVQKPEYTGARQNVDLDTMLGRRRDPEPLAGTHGVGLAEFLRGEGWDAHIQGSDRAYLRHLASAPSATEPHLESLQRHVLTYLKLGETLIRRNRGNGVLEFFSPEQKLVGSFDCVKPFTLEAYARDFGRVLCLVMRRSREPASSTYLWCFDGEVLESCTQLWSVLESETAEDPLTLKYVHKLALELAGAECRQDKFQSAINSALVLVSLHPDGGWSPTSVIAKTVTSFIYCVRSTLLYHCQTLDEDVDFDGLQPLLYEECSSSMSYLLRIYRQLVALRANSHEGSIVRFIDRRSMLYLGDVINLEDVKRMLPALADRYRTLVDRDIFHGLQDHRSLRLEYNVRELDDDLRDRSPFSSFIDDPRNPFLGRKDNLLILLLTHRELAGRYHHGVDRVIWLPGPSLQLLAAIEHARTLLLVITHLTYASPGRTADVLTRSIGNMSESNMRSVLMLKERLCFVSAGSQSGVAIVRPLPDFLAKLWIQYLVLIRPVEVEMARQLFGEEAGARYRCHIHPAGTHHFPPPDFSEALGDATEEFLGTRFALREWKLVQLSLARQQLGERQMDFDDERHGALEVGLPTEALKNLNQGRLETCMLLAKNWHRVILGN